MLDEIYENPLVPKVDEKLTAEEAMELTWRIALQGVGFVRSNPLVGAVCVDKDHRFVAAAYHEAQRLVNPNDGVVHWLDDLLFGKWSGLE